MLKYYITVSFWQFTTTLNQFFYLSSAQENLETYIQVWVIKRTKEFLRYFQWIIFKQKDIISKIQNIMFAENCYM